MNTILDNLLPLLVTVLTPILVYFANKLINLIAVKLQLSNVADITSAVDSIITKAVQAAEEWAMGEINSPVPVPTPTPTPAPTATPTSTIPVNPVPTANMAKIDMAKRVAVQEFTYRGLPVPEDAHIEALINAYCGRRRQLRAAKAALFPAYPAPAVEVKKIPTIAEKITKKG
jgi:hypothetical protein